MSVLATDDFNRANGGLGANWTTSTIAGNALSISSNAVTFSAIGNDCAGHYTAISWPNDQYSQISVTGTGNTSIGDDIGFGVTTRVSNAGSGSGYRCVADRGSSLNVGLSKIVSGVYTNLWTRTSAWTSGDVLRVENQGTTLRVYHSAVQIGTSTTDSALTAGSAGIVYSAPENAAIGGDDWSGGDFSTGAISPAVSIRTFRAAFIRSNYW